MSTVSVNPILPPLMGQNGTMTGFFLKFKKLNYQQIGIYFSIQIIQNM